MGFTPSGAFGMSIAYSYIRFSHPDQRRGNSLRRQLGRSRRYAEAKGLSLDDTIQDLARSAFHNRHTVTGNLGGFLALAREGEIAAGSYLLVESFDRLSRDEFWPAFELIRDIFKARINLTTLPDDDEVHEYSYDAINKNPTLINEIINDLTRAHRESKIKSVRCRDACEMQREEARAGIAKIPGRCPAWLQPIRGVIIGGRQGEECDHRLQGKNRTGRSRAADLRLGSGRSRDGRCYLSIEPRGEAEVRPYRLAQAHRRGVIAQSGSHGLETAAQDGRWR